jgi:glucosylglycerate synthase
MSSVIQRRDVRTNIHLIKDAEILVGVHTFNNSGTIAHVIRAIYAGLLAYFPGRRAVIINSDGGSTDGTLEIVRKIAAEDYYSIQVRQRVTRLFSIPPEEGIPGRGSAFRTIFEIAEALNVRACAVVDSDVQSITPEWIERLIRPLTDGFDYVLPLYQRHKYEGTLNNNLIYPVTRALYGKRVRQPIGGDYGFSGDLAKFFLEKDVWETNVARNGIDIWMTTSAIANGFSVCQSFLGPKGLAVKDSGARLSAILNQVVGSMFDLMEEYSPSWRKIKGSEEVTTFGSPVSAGLEPVAVNIDRMIERFGLGARELIYLWEKFLSRDIIDFLKKLTALRGENFYIPDEIWAEVIYSFAIALHRKIINREHLLKSLTPLYIGKTASFVMETRECSARQIEMKIEQLCRIFEHDKLFLNINWRNRERL